MAQAIVIEPIKMEEGEIDEEESMEEGEIEEYYPRETQNCKIYERNTRGFALHLCDIPIGFCCTHKNARIPKQSYDNDAGYDLFSPDEYTIKPGQKVKIDIGLQMIIPPHIFGEITSRSGLAYNCGIEVVGGKGIIDSNYRGHIYVGLRNTSVKQHYKVNIGSRIAQIIFQPCYRVTWARYGNIYESLTPTERGEKAYGSSGGY